MLGRGICILVIISGYLIKYSKHCLVGRCKRRADFLSVQWEVTGVKKIVSGDAPLPEAIFVGKNG